MQFVAIDRIAGEIIGRVGPNGVLELSTPPWGRVLRETLTRLPDGLPF